MDKDLDFWLELFFVYLFYRLVLNINFGLGKKRIFLLMKKNMQFIWMFIVIYQNKILYVLNYVSCCMGVYSFRKSDSIILDVSFRLENIIRSNFKLRILRFIFKCSGLIRV